ncbi:MAG TPA: hypothetical protein VFG84_00285 [Gemmatimonadaceae bacterium]|nr:hypothetical protein [Gemmatimonadaceae bacterium]
MTMNLSVRFTVTAALALLAVVGCDLSTGPSPSNEFAWSVVENAAEARDAMDAAAFAGDVNILGQLTTPTLCYNLASNFIRNGASLTLRVTANSSSATNCDQSAGGLRYTAVFRNAGRGEHPLLVVHSVPGFPDREYTDTLTID